MHEAFHSHHVTDIRDIEVGVAEERRLIEDDILIRIGSGSPAFRPR